MFPIAAFRVEIDTARIYLRGEGGVDLATTFVRQSTNFASFPCFAYFQTKRKFEFKTPAFVKSFDRTILVNVAIYVHKEVEGERERENM